MLACRHANTICFHTKIQPTLDNLELSGNKSPRCLASSPDERSDIRDDDVNVIPGYRCAHPGYSLWWLQNGTMGSGTHDPSRKVEALTVKPTRHEPRER